MYRRAADRPYAASLSKSQSPEHATRISGGNDSGGQIPNHSVRESVNIGWHKD